MFCFLSYSFRLFSLHLLAVTRGSTIEPFGHMVTGPNLAQQPKLDPILSKLTQNPYTTNLHSPKPIGGPKGGETGPDFTAIGSDQ